MSYFLPPEIPWPSPKQSYVCHGEEGVKPGIRQILDTPEQLCRRRSASLTHKVYNENEHTTGCGWCRTLSSIVSLTR